MFPLRSTRLLYAVHAQDFRFSHCEIVKSREEFGQPGRMLLFWHISLNRSQGGIQLPGWWLNNQDSFFFLSKMPLTAWTGSSRLDGTQKAGGARAWIDNPLPSRSKACGESWTNSPRSLLHRRTGGRQECLVWRLAGYYPLKAGRR